MSFKLPYYSSLHIIIIVEDKIIMNNMKITNLQIHTFLLGFVFAFESGFVFPLGSGLGLVPL